MRTLAGSAPFRAAGADPTALRALRRAAASRRTSRRFPAAAEADAFVRAVARNAAAYLGPTARATALRAGVWRGYRLDTVDCGCPHEQADAVIIARRGATVAWLNLRRPTSARAGDRGAMTAAPATSTPRPPRATAPSGTAG